MEGDPASGRTPASAGAGRTLRGKSPERMEQVRELERGELVAHDTNGRLAFSFDMGTAEGQYFVAISGDADTGLGAAPLLSNGPVVLTHEKTKQISFFAKTGDFDECQLDKSGQWLVIKEQVDGAKGEDNVIVNLQTGQQTRFLDQAGAAGHSNDGYGCMVAADNWNPCRGRCGCGTSISPSHPPSRGRRRRGCSCITPRTGRRTSAISPTPMPGPTCLRTSSTCAEAPQATVARRHRPPETGNTVKDNKASSNTQGGFDLSGSGQKLTGSQSNHAAGAFDYRISVTPAVSARSGNKATAARSPPEASATASSRTRRCGVGFARPRDARGGGAADRHDPVGEGPGTRKPPQQRIAPTCRIDRSHAVSSELRSLTRLTIRIP